LECISPSQYQSFEGSLTLHTPRSVIPNASKLPKQQWTIKEIADACNGFYLGLFWRELAEIKEREYLKADWINQLQDLLANGLLKRLNDGQAFLLRVGRHSGAEALTLNGLRNIRIMQGKGQPAKSGKQPITWWLAADQSNDNQNLLPFGWLLVEINPQQNDNQIQQSLEHNSTQIGDWMQTQLSKQNALKQQAESRLQKEREKQLQQQQDQAEQQQKQQAEQQRLANLSPLDQELETLLEKLPLAEHDSKLLQMLKAGHWQSKPDQQNVAVKIKTLMEQSGKWMPDSSSENKVKIKNKQRSQEVLTYLED
jgi:CRISPR-associated protein Csm5